MFTGFRTFAIAVLLAAWTSGQSGQSGGGMTGGEATRILKSPPWARKALSIVTPRDRDWEWTDARNGWLGMNSADHAEMAATILQSNGFQQWNPPQLTFRWETAAAVRQALKKSGEAAVDAGAAYYVISAMSESKSGAHDLFGLTAIASQIRNDAHASTTMTITGKANGVSTLQATKLEEGTRGGLPILFFFFPRSREIKPDDDEVVVQSSWHRQVAVTRWGVKDAKRYFLAVTAKADFRPGEMIYHGFLGL